MHPYPLVLFLPNASWPELLWTVATGLACLLNIWSAWDTRQDYLAARRVSRRRLAGVPRDQLLRVARWRNRDDLLRVLSLGIFAVVGLFAMGQPNTQPPTRTAWVLLGGFVAVAGLFVYGALVARFDRESVLRQGEAREWTRLENPVDESED